jgi:hypothetical protein
MIVVIKCRECEYFDAGKCGKTQKEIWPEIDPHKAGDFPGSCPLPDAPNQKKEAKCQKE